MAARSAPASLFLAPMAIFLLAPTAAAYQLNPAIPTRSCVRLSASDDEASGAAALDPRVAELAPPEAHERMQAGL